MFRNLTPNAIGIKADLASTIKLAKADGWQGIDLPIVEALKIAKTQSIEIVQQQLSESGLRLGGWGLPFDWRQDYGQDALDTLAEQAALAQSHPKKRITITASSLGKNVATCPQNSFNDIKKISIWFCMAPPNWLNFSMFLSAAKDGDTGL